MTAKIEGLEGSELWPVIEGVDQAICQGVWDKLKQERRYDDQVLRHGRYTFYVVKNIIDEIRTLHFCIGVLPPNADVNEASSIRELVLLKRKGRFVLIDNSNASLDEGTTLTPGEANLILQAIVDSTRETANQDSAVSDVISKIRGVALKPNQDKMA